jgi:hypothetical protein
MYCFQGFGGKAYDLGPKIGVDQVTAKKWELLSHLSQNSQNVLKLAVEYIARADDPRYAEVVSQGTRLLALMERRDRRDEIERIKRETSAQVWVNYQAVVTPRHFSYQKHKWNTILCTSVAGTSPISYLTISHLVDGIWPQVPHAQINFTGRESDLRADSFLESSDRHIDCLFTMALHAGWITSGEDDHGYETTGWENSKVVRILRGSLKGENENVSLGVQVCSFGVVNANLRKQRVGEVSGKPYLYELPPRYQGIYAK